MTEEGSQAWGAGSSKVVPTDFEMGGLQPVDIDMGSTSRELPPIRSSSVTSTAKPGTLSKGGKLTDSIAELYELNRLGFLSDDECSVAKKSLLVNSGLAVSTPEPLAQVPMNRAKPSSVSEVEQAISVSVNPNVLWEKTKLKGDFFAYKPPGGKLPQRSAIGVAGSALAVTIIAAFLWASISQFVNDVTGLNSEVRPRFEYDFAPIPEIGGLIQHGNNAFYDESYFIWKTRLRAIFEGDSNNDVRPRVYVEADPITCNIYTIAGDDGKIDNTTGKTAVKGCVDARAMSDSLLKKQTTPSTDDAPNNDPSEIPDVPIVQGQYGSDAYWFLELKLVGCPDYGGVKNTKYENVTCANSTAVKKMFDDNTFTVDVVMKSQLTREYTINSNIYLNVDIDRWNGIETYLQLTQSFETDRDIPQVTKDPVKLLKFSQYSSRAQAKFGNDYMTFYIRLYDQVNEETIQHFTLLEMLSALGGAYGLTKLLTTTVFTNANKLVYNANKYGWYRKLIPVTVPKAHAVSS